MQTWPTSSCLGSFGDFRCFKQTASFQQFEVSPVFYGQKKILFLFFYLTCFVLTFLEATSNLQYSSKIVETGAIWLDFSPNFLHSRFTPVLSLKCAALLPQCWAERILEHWNDCKPKSLIGEGKITQVSQDLWRGL